MFEFAVFVLVVAVLVFKPSRRSSGNGRRRSAREQLDYRVRRFERGGWIPIERLARDRQLPKLRLR